jgi:hypothetical protein
MCLLLIYTYTFIHICTYRYTVTYSYTFSCIYTITHTCTHYIPIYTCISTYTRANLHAYMHTHLCTFSTCIYTLSHTWTHNTNSCTLIKHVHTCIRTNTHLYPCINTHANTHVHKLEFSFKIHWADALWSQFLIPSSWDTKPWTPAVIQVDVLEDGCVHAYVHWVLLKTSRKVGCGDAHL